MDNMYWESGIKAIVATLGFSLDNDEDNPLELDA